MRGLSLVLIFGALLLLVGCGSTATATTSSGGAPTAGRTTVATSGSTSSPATATPAETVTLTQDDAYKTTTVPVGRRILVKLGTERDWEVTLPDQSVLQPVIGVALIRGAQALYTAAQPGQATIQANGKAICATPGAACSNAIVHLEFTVVVQGS